MANVAPQIGPEEKAKLGEWFLSTQSDYTRLNGRLKFMTLEVSSHKYPEDAIRASSKAIHAMLAKMESICAEFESNVVAPHLVSCCDALYEIYSFVTDIKRDTLVSGKAAKLLSNARASFQRNETTLEIIQKILESERVVGEQQHQQSTDDNLAQKEQTIGSKGAPEGLFQELMDMTALASNTDDISPNILPSKTACIEESREDEFNQSDNGLKIGEGTPAVVIPLPTQEVQNTTLPTEPKLQNNNPESHISHDKNEIEHSNKVNNMLVDEEERDNELNADNASDDKSKRNGKRAAEVSDSAPEPKRVDLKREEVKDTGSMMADNSAMKNQQVGERSGVASVTQDQQEHAVETKSDDQNRTVKPSDRLNALPPASFVHNLGKGTEEDKEDGMEVEHVQSGNGSGIDQKIGNKTIPVISPLPSHQVPVNPSSMELDPQDNNPEFHQPLHHHEMNNSEEVDDVLAKVDGQIQGSETNTGIPTGEVPAASHAFENQNQEDEKEEQMEVEEPEIVETHGNHEEPMELVEEALPTVQTLRSPIVTPSNELRNDPEHPSISALQLPRSSPNALNHDDSAKKDDDVQQKSSDSAPGSSNQIFKPSDEAEDVESVSVKAEKTKRNITWHIPADKELEPNFRTAKGIYFHSRKFFAEAHLFSVLNQKGSVTSRAEVRSYFESIKKRFTESNCFEVELPIGFDLAGNKNYRGLKPVYVGHILVNVSIPLPNLPENYLLFPPPLQFTGSVHMDAFNVTGEQIIEAASQIYSDEPEERKTFLGAPSDLKVFPGGDISTVGKEREDFVAYGGQPKEESQKAEEANYFPVVSYPGSIMHQPDDLEEACRTHHFFKVKDVWNELKLDTELFEIETLAAKEPNSVISVLRQIPQEIRFNFPFSLMKGGNNEQQAKKWESKGLQKIDVSLEQLKDLFKQLNDLAETAYEQLEYGTETVERVMDDLDKNLKMVSDGVKLLEKEAKAVHQVAVLLFFGSNIDLSEKSFPEQSKEIESKFPVSWAPRGKGDLLKLTGTIPGMTHAQAYAKSPGSRTNAHQENNSVGSINVNKGPGSSYWCVIPPEYNDQFQRLVFKKLSNKNICKTGYFPNLEDCIAEGIPVQKCEQKAGDGIYVGPATYHWVQSNGFSLNISWNVCRPTSCQLAAAMIHHDHVMQNGGLSLVSLQDILFQLPMNDEIRMDTEMLQVVKISLMRLLIACTQELEFVRTQRPRWTVVTASPDLKDVERCSRCKNVLFNLVPKIVVTRELKTYCFQCLDHPHSKKPSKDRDVTIHQRYDLTLIAEKFDMLKVAAPTF